MRHTIQELRQMQAMPLELKIRMSERRIKTWYDHFRGLVYVSFSGGKDSTVLKHLVENTLGVYDVPSVFVNTGLEYPEIQKFAMSQPNVVTIRPKMRFDEVVREYGYPVISKEISKKAKDAKSYIAQGRTDGYALAQFNGTYKSKNGNKSIYDCRKYRYLLDSDFRISHQCCDVMKKRPLKEYGKRSGRHPYLGTMADESFLRRQKWLMQGCNAFDNRNPVSQPMSFWTEQDVLEYIRAFKLDYCPIYGDIVEDEKGLLTTTGANRTGCIFCMFGCHLEKEPNRFQCLKDTHPNQYRYCIGGGEYVDGIWQPNKEGLGLAHVLDFIGVKYE